jgi:hypothetical protein
MRRALACFVIALALAACGGGEPAFTAEELARIMPPAGDAPARTQFLEQQSGPLTLDEFVVDEEVGRKLDSLGFQKAHTSTFATPNLPDDLTLTQPGASLYGAFGVLLADADRAREGFAFYSERLRTRAKDYTPVLSTRLGSQSVAFRFSQLEATPLPGLAFIWRLGNALFGIVGVGNPDTDPAAVRALAEKMEERARS